MDNITHIWNHKEYEELIDLVDQSSRMRAVGLLDYLLRAAEEKGWGRGAMEQRLVDVALSKYSPLVGNKTVEFKEEN